MCLSAVSKCTSSLSSRMLYSKVLKWVSFKIDLDNVKSSFFIANCKRSFWYYKVSLWSSRESRQAGPEILFGKTGHDLPIHQIGNSDPEVFAAYTAPDGGITSISKLEDRLSSSMQEADHSEDFDFIDLDDFTSSNSASNKRRPSANDIPSELEYGVSKLN